MSLVGDSEFGSIKVLRCLDRWNWRYVLRQKANHLIQRGGQTSWERFGDLIKRGQLVWLTSALLTRRHAYSANLLAYWRRGEKEPWLLVPNMPTSRATLRAYKRRMWLEEMFGDLDSTTRCKF